MKNLLLVDDEASFLHSLRDGLNTAMDSVEVFCAANGQESCDILENTAVDLVVTDLEMPVMDGF